MIEFGSVCIWQLWRFPKLVIILTIHHKTITCAFSSHYSIGSRKLNSVKSDYSLTKMKKGTCFNICVYVFQCQNLISQFYISYAYMIIFVYCLSIDGFLRVHSFQVLKLQFLNLHSFHVLFFKKIDQAFMSFVK